MTIFRADKLYFDELSKGISAGLNHDGGFNYDADTSNLITGTSTVDLGVQKYWASEILDVVIVSEFGETENYSKYVNLMELVPLKFHDSVVLQELLDECGILTGTWIGQINDVEKLLDKYNVGTDYIQYLSDLVGYKIINADTATIDEKRRQLIQVIDWYKEKGIYLSLEHIAYVLGFNLNVLDMYTNSEVNYDNGSFTTAEWFVGHEGENPTGLSSSYFKTPHTTTEIILDKVYGDASDGYLFIESMMTYLTEYVELVRPVNVVIHYSTFLNPITTESGEVYTGNGNVSACINGDWEFSRKYFDMSGDSLHFDSDPTTFFDYTYDSFLNGITHFKLGTGNVGGLPNEADTDLETPIKTGDVLEYTAYVDRVEFLLGIGPSWEYLGITEIGLFLEDETTMVAEATFPSVDKIQDIELRVIFIIYI